ncbi:MAG TPA: efflux RND transporter periplasmic adaptor subunit [Usitatibacter sp.]|nr:efflux RND transporter periplasmic adaptor subunit [Usitatibacter sp.]
MMATSSCAVAATAILLLVGAGCSNSEHAGPAAKEKAAKEQPARQAPPDAHGGALGLTEAEMAAEGVKLAPVTRELMRAEVTLTATIEPDQDRIAHIAPRVPGRLIQVPARLGDVVRQGQVLALVDSVEVGEASAAYQQAASQLAVAKSEFERASKLREEDVVPEKEFLRTRGEYEKARAAHAAALDKLRMMGVKPASNAESTLPVTSPLPGTVIEKHAVIGELAQPDKPLFTVADLSSVWIEARLYEKDLGRIRPGAQATVTVTAYPDERFEGKLAYVSAVVERESRTVKARIEVPNRDGRLKPEMFATATIATQERRDTLAIPASAVTLLDGRQTVFVKRDAGFEPRLVELGERVGDRQVVTAGLVPGEVIVVSGTYALKSRLLKSKIGDEH